MSDWYKALIDNQTASQLSESHLEAEVFSALNEGDSNPWWTTVDGRQLFAPDHIFGSSTYSNLHAGPMDSETLNQVYFSIGRMPWSAHTPTAEADLLVIVPEALRYVALNTVRGVELVVDSRLQDQDDWFVVKPLRGIFQVGRTRDGRVGLAAGEYQFIHKVINS